MYRLVGANNVVRAGGTFGAGIVGSVSRYFEGNGRFFDCHRLMDVLDSGFVGNALERFVRVGNVQIGGQKAL